MNLQLFEHIILKLQVIQEKNNKVFKLGIDLANFEDDYGEIITHLFRSYFGEEADDWISWFLYERISHNGEILTAYDKDGNLICYDIPSLWECVEELRKTKKEYHLPTPMTDQEREELLKKMFQ